MFYLKRQERSEVAKRVDLKSSHCKKKKMCNYV